MESGGLKVKDLPPVLSASSLIDVCLSKTQRKTPTEIHKRSNISVIKKFYIRKVKASSEFFTEKLKQITQNFPKLDSIHPFYGDLLNILYDRDHYKLALGNVASCTNKIEKICKEYITLIKYADSLYKAKSLKTAALGRYCTGKSSFINLISNANVDVQPFAFTTKSLFVGHFNHLYARWQVSKI
ncbi:nucleolar GTP-binding protein, putative [Eimeria acervulina]|uniref:Nucleolar GTP-binding protein, putative n=1 Tax=Eimeria acervulina TaxID=5801 RepID=U6GAY9_EIMAC|nr:nucleolar GTP-binding protein, putative [Eimeria acervulina]CDI77300.1 nucleolar GTP-binding protein, putative [Eimeria acervulina]